MKKSIGLVAATVVAIAIAPAAQAQPADAVTVVNRTGYTISELYIAPNDSNDWEEDILGVDILDDGESTNIDFRRAEDTCWWDMMVVYAEDDEHVTWQNVDLCEDSRFELFYDRSSGETSFRSH